jgi:hypothetical protein
MGISVLSKERVFLCPKNGVRHTTNRGHEAIDRRISIFHDSEQLGRVIER